MPRSISSFFSSEQNRPTILDLTLLGFSMLIGLLAAVGALVFRVLIELFQTLFWAQGHSLMEQVANTPWWLVLAIPAIGGFLAGPLITFLVPEARGPGVPEVILAVTTRQSTIRHRVTLLKAAVTGLLLGTGASVGREGPIVQIGSSVGSSLAPITAILTIFELTLHYQIILPLMLACISSTLVVRFLYGYSAYELKLLRKHVFEYTAVLKFLAPRIWARLRPNTGFQSGTGYPPKSPSGMPGVDLIFFS